MGLFCVFFPPLPEKPRYSLLPNTQRKQDTKMGCMQWGRETILSHHGTSQQVNIDYIFLVPRAIISDTAACCQR